MSYLKVIGIAIGVALLVVVVALSFRPIPQGTIKEIVKEVKQIGAIPGNTVGDMFCIEGLCTAVRSGSCNDATTTLFAIRNPFNSSSSVTYIAIDGTIGTTTPDIFVGTSTQIAAPRYAPEPGPFSRIFWGFRIPTSTASFYVSNSIEPNGDLANLANGSPTINSISTSTAQQFLLKPLDYVMGVATNSYSGARDGISGDAITGIIGGNNTFSCNYVVEIKGRLR